MNDQERQVFEAVTRDSAAVLEKNAELTDKVVPSLTKRAEDAESALSALRKEAGDKIAKLRESVSKVADIWVDRGLLKSEKKAQVVEMVVNDPAQGIEALEKIASNAAAVQLGEADNEKIAGDGMDPIERFAMS